MTEVGRMLEDARLRKGITLEKVEKELKIRKHYLIAMETGRWEELPGYAYATGFLRTYGDYLGLPGEDLAEEYRYWRETQGTTAAHDETPIGVFTRSKELETDSGIFQLGSRSRGRSRRRKVYKGIAVMLILLAALGAYLFLTWKQPFSDTQTLRVEDADVGELKREPIEPIENTLPFLPGVEPLSELGDNGKMLPVESSDPSDDVTSLTYETPKLDHGLSGEALGRLEHEEPIKESDSPVAKQPLDENAGVELTLPIDEIHRLPPTEELEGASYALVLEAKANGRCWVEVRSDGQVVYSDTLSMGDTYIWSAQEEIRVRFGNAGAVELRLNDQDLGIAGKGVLTRVFTASSD